MATPTERIDANPNALRFASEMFLRIQERHPSEALFIAGQQDRIVIAQTESARWQNQFQRRRILEEAPAIIRLALPDREKGPIFELTHYPGDVYDKNKREGKPESEGPPPQFVRAILTETGMIPDCATFPDLFDKPELAVHVDQGYRLRQGSRLLIIDTPPADPKIKSPIYGEMRFRNPELMGPGVYLTAVIGDFEPILLDGKYVLPKIDDIVSIHIRFETADAIARCGQDPDVLRAAGIRRDNDFKSKSTFSPLLRRILGLRPVPPTG